MPYIGIAPKLNAKTKTGAAASKKLFASKILWNFSSNCVLYEKMRPRFVLLVLGFALYSIVVSSLLMWGQPSQLNQC